MRQGVIYCFTCLVTQDEYIGQAECFDLRFKGHCRAVRENAPYPLYRAVKKYGWKNFAVRILRKCRLEDMNYWETHYIDKFETLSPCGYNLTEGGEGTRGVVWREESRVKLAKAVKAQWNDPVHRALKVRRMRETQAPHTRSRRKKSSDLMRQYHIDNPTARERTAVTRRGIPHTEETKQRMRESQRKRLDGLSEASKMRTAKRRSIGMTAYYRAHPELKRPAHIYVCDEITRANMAAAARLRWARQRALG